LRFGEAYQLPVVALRYFNCYGPRQSLSNPYTGMVAIFLSRLLNRKPPVIFEDGMQSRNLIHVLDIARANVLALTSSGADFHAVNVGSGAAVTVLEVFRRLSAILNVAIADCQDALDDLQQRRVGDGSTITTLNPNAVQALQTIKQSLETAKANADANRPSFMTNVLPWLDIAKQDFFSSNPNNEF